MEVFDFLWNLSHERQLDELRGKLDRVRLEHDLAADETRNLRDLIEENLQLKLRLGLLVRLLISKGVFTAEEFAALIAQTRPTSTDISAKRSGDADGGSTAIQPHRN